MKWYLITGLSALYLMSGCMVKKTEKKVTVMQQDQEEPTWQGPGYYDGVWIQNEDQFNDWKMSRNLPDYQDQPMQPQPIPQQQPKPKPSKPMDSY